MQHEVFAIVLLQPINDLFILAGAQCRYHQSLGLAAGKECRTVGPRHCPDLNCDRPYGLGVTAVDTSTSLQNILADDVLLQTLENVIASVFDELGIECLVCCQLLSNPRLATALPRVWRCT